MVSKVIGKTMVFIVIMLFCFSLTIFADTNEVTVYVDNEKVDFDVNPVLENGRTLVPLRGVFEKLGAQVEWNKNIMQVIIKDKNNEISMLLGKSKVLVNGVIVDIDTSTKMINSRTFAPLRFVSETLGHDIRWDGNTNSVYISRKESEAVNKDIIPTIGSRENLIALLEYNSKIGRYIGLRGYFDTGFSEGVASDTANEAAESTASKNDSSSTNNQVEGVEEGDIIKNDGKHIFINTYNGIKIIDSDPSDPKIISEVIVPENTHLNEIFITESRLIAIGENNYYSIYNNYDKEMEMKIMPISYYENRCNILIYNIENIEKPVLEREYLFDGTYSSGRVIDNELYLITTKYLNLGYDFYDRNNYEIPLPSYTDCILYEETLFGYDEIKYFPSYVDSKYMLTVGINLNDKNSVPDVDIYLGSTDSIYVSKNNLYAAVTDYSYDSQIKSSELYSPIYSINTVLYKFSLKDGHINPISQGEVPGTIINQFSMDEYNDVLRIATTTGQMWSTGQNESKNNVYTLDKNLNIIGKLEGIAPGERIYSTRFMEDKVFMVTFKQVDPFFVIDTSLPENPQMLGYLKIPGYSTYLHIVDESHILGFGYDTTENEWGGTDTNGFKISFFDVTNVKKPKETDTEVIGKAGTYSELLYNHKALMFSLEKGLMAFPINRTTDGYKSDFVGAYVYNINNESFNLKMKINHMDVQNEYSYGDEIRRVIYIGDYLYSISDNRIHVYSIESNRKVGQLIIK